MHFLGTELQEGRRDIEKDLKGKPAQKYYELHSCPPGLSCTAPWTSRGCEIRIVWFQRFCRISLAVLLQGPQLGEPKGPRCLLGISQDRIPMLEHVDMRLSSLAVTMVPAPPAEEGSVMVAVRVRPQTPREQEGNRNSTVQVIGKSLLVFDPEEPSLPGMLAGFDGADSAPRRKGKDLKFVFDRVFGESATQAEVFESTTKEILDGVLNGYNCSGKAELASFFAGDVAVATGLLSSSWAFQD